MHISLSVVGAAAVFVLVVYGRVSAVRLRKGYEGVTPRTLSDEERALLKRWQTRSIVLFVLVMLSILPISLLLAFTAIPALGRLGIYLLFISGAVLGVVHCFTARCPNCGRRVAFQSSLLVPRHCEVCGATLK